MLTREEIEQIRFSNDLEAPTRKVVSQLCDMALRSLSEREAVIEELIAELSARADKMNDEAQALYAQDTAIADGMANNIGDDVQQLRITIRTIRALSPKAAK